LAGKKEIQRLKKIRASEKSQFIAIYGRRRVGKTLLVREFFENRFDFQLTGLAHANTAQQLFNFHSSFTSQASEPYDKAPEKWYLAFQRLMRFLESKKHAGQKVIFLVLNLILVLMWDLFY
jgi:AAA+ ATPase superfamily predicted ATPase